MHGNSILFLTNAYPDFESSYRGIFIKTLALLLQKEEYQISVVTPKIYSRSRYFEKQNGLKVYRFPFWARNKLLIEHKKIPYFKMILYYLTGVFLTLYAMLKNRCCLIHVHWAIPTGLIGAWVGLLLRRRLVVTIHGSDLRMAVERNTFIRKIFVYVCRRATHVNCVSEVQRKEVERLGIAGEKISVISMGIDEVFLETGKNRRLELTERPFVVFSNRNLFPIYNVSTLIRAIPMILKEEPKIQFIIAGNGSEKEILRKAVEDLNVSNSVQFLGQVPHKDMPGLLAHSDIFVSTSPYDGTSVSLLEALACGTFPVVTDIPSNREWITDGKNGFLVPNGNETLLAEKIIDAIRNHKLLEEAGEKNQRIAERRACWKGNVRKIRELYNSQ